MTIQKKGNKWAVVHCHGKDKGKTIGTHGTKKEALAQHRAIQVSKHSSLSSSGQKLLNKLKRGKQ